MGRGRQFGISTTAFSWLLWYKNQDNQEDESNYKSNDERWEYPPPGDTDEPKEFEDEEDNEDHTKISNTSSGITATHININ